VLRGSPRCMLIDTRAVLDVGAPRWQVLTQVIDQFPR
jgi:hypothetical protein